LKSRSASEIQLAQATPTALAMTDFNFQFSIFNFFEEPQGTDERRTELKA
jgi:hypothetical protein